MHSVEGFIHRIYSIGINRRQQVASNLVSMPNLRWTMFSVLLVSLASLSLLCLTQAASVSDMGSEGREQVDQLSNARRQHDETTTIHPVELLNRDDYHSNIDLNDLTQFSPRYTYNDDQSDSSADKEPSRLSWLQNLLASTNQQRFANRYSRSPFVAYLGQHGSTAHKNAAMAHQHPMNDPKEDRDLSYAAMPIKGAKFDQDLASRVSEFANELLTEMVKADRKSQQSQKRTSKQLLQQDSDADDYTNMRQNGGVSSAIEPSKARPKRRRCNEDRNIGVKNPTFCDNESYFGAADYSMRNVWDSAGR